MIKKLFFTLLAITALMACTTSHKQANKAQTNIRKVEFGMTKNELISVMGNLFTSEAGVRDTNGNLEIISYDSNEIPYQNVRYVFHLRNGKLAEWHRVLPEPPVVLPPAPHPHHPRGENTPEAPR